MKETRFSPGENHWNSKLTDCDVDSIKQLKAQGISNTHIAEKFQVNQSTISRITSGLRRTGRDLPEKQVRLCEVEGCGQKYFAKGCCSKHYGRWRTHGDPLISNRAENGSGSTTADGYRLIPVPPHTPGATKRSESHWVMTEHRFIMQQLLGRPLKEHENVHHKNGVRSDNRVENLELWTRSQPQGKRITDLLEWARWLITEYSDCEEQLLNLKEGD